MHAVVRTYAGPGAKELMDLIIEKQDEIEALIRGVSGFTSYQLVRTGDGGATVTVCEDKVGTDESLQVAREWVAANGAHLGAAAPTVSEGDVGIHWN